ncbi:MAG: glycosyltransferase family 4 protein [Bryobacteraceae bacterium]|nr:glycosyltransferase family 4 protein [Bryobacteraceae bacterium]
MQTHAVEIANRLHAAGHTLEVLTYRARDDAALRFDAALASPVRRVLSRVSFWRNIELAAEAARAADLIYASTIYFGLAGERAGVPVVCRSAGNDLQRPWIAYPFRFGSAALSAPWFEDRAYRWFRRRRGPEWLDRLLKQTRRDLARASAAANDHVFANSRYTAELLAAIAIPPARREVLCGGVDAEAFGAARQKREEARAAFGVAAGEFCVLTACRLVPKKGIDFLLRAMAAAGGDPWTLLVAGDGPYRRDYRVLAESLGLLDRVRFAGRLPHTAMPGCFAAADAFVLSSHDVAVGDGAVDAETMGRVLCEANAAGVPVLASRCGGVESVVECGVNGLLFEPRNPAAFLEALERLRRDGKLRRRIVEGGLEAARTRFDWRVIVRRHQQVFERIAAREGTVAAPVHALGWERS